MTDSSEFVSKTRKKDRAETLWDLELEKENEDQMKETEQIVIPTRVEDSERKRRQLSDFIIPNNQNLLAQISSTGILLKPLDTAQSTLDFAFVLNVRESELYPPLLLADDLKCLEDKIAVYQNEFTSGEIFLEFIPFLKHSSCDLLFQNTQKPMWNWQRSNSLRNA